MSTPPPPGDPGLGEPVGCCPGVCDECGISQNTVLVESDNTPCVFDGPVSFNDFFPGGISCNWLWFESGQWNINAIYNNIDDEWDFNALHIPTSTQYILDNQPGSALSCLGGTLTGVVVLPVASNPGGCQTSITLTFG